VAGDRRDGFRVFRAGGDLMHLSFGSDDDVNMYIHCKREQVPSEAGFVHDIDANTAVFVMHVGRIDIRFMVDKSEGAGS